MRATQLGTQPAPPREAQWDGPITLNMKYALHEQSESERARDAERKLLYWGAPTSEAEMSNAQSSSMSFAALRSMNPAHARRKREPIGPHRPRCVRACERASL